MHSTLSRIAGIVCTLAWAMPAITIIASAMPAATVTFRLASHDAVKLVTDSKTFETFAKPLQAEIERLLGVPAVIDDPASLRMLLAMRVHLAHSFADNARATATAAWIRSLQTDPATRAFAGLTTFAAVATREETNDARPSSPEYQRTFARAFAAQLAGLPFTPEVTEVLRSQREKTAAITREALLREAREVLAPALRARATCTLAEADAIVRVQHRLEGIVPVRDVMLRVLDAAIRERAAP